jgi:hypothetical protein
MSKRKLLAVFLLLLLTATLTAGCSQAELGFLDLQKELSELNTTETSGDFVFSLKGLPVPATADAAETLLYNMLQKEVTIKYTGKTDLGKNIVDCTFFLVDNSTNTEQILTRIICKDNIIYLKIDELLKLAQGMGEPETSNKLQEVFGNTKYISMTQEEYRQSIADVPEQPFSKLNQNAFMNNQLNNVLQKLVVKIPEAYQNYSPGLVVQNGNTYSWEITGTQALQLLGGFLEYTINNITDLEKCIVSFLDALNDEEMTVWGLEPQEKTSYKTFLNEATTEIANNKEEYLQVIGALQTGLQQKGEIPKAADGLKISYTLGKNEQEVYANTFAFTMNLEEEGTQVGLQMQGQSQTKKTAPFTVTTPTANLMTYTEYLQKVRRTMEIQVDTNTYTLTDAKGSSQNSLEVKNIENQTYLPMRQIAEIFGEEVSWDAENSQAYVLRNGDKIDLTGVIIDGRTYIKTRDFAKLDYKVSWNDGTRTVIISTTTL